MVLQRVVGWVVLGFIASFIVRIILLLDINKRVYNHTPGPCRYLPFIEDGTFGMELTSLGIFISAKNNQKGSLAIFKTTDNPMYELEQVTIKGFNEDSFQPLKLTSSESKGRLTIYVLNGYGNNKSIEVFSWQKEKRALFHRQSIWDPLLSSASDITAIGSDRLFISTLTHFGQGSILSKAELLFQSPFGSVLFYDGKKISVVARLSSPSSVAFDKKKKRLYVGSYLNELVRVYSIGADFIPIQLHDISLLSSPTSIFVDRNSSDLWLAMQPILYQSIFQINDPSKLSSSQILRIRMQPDGESWVITEPYANDGASVSAATDIVFFGEHITIGSGFGKILHCDLVNPQIT